MKTLHSAMKLLIRKRPPNPTTPLLRIRTTPTLPLHTTQELVSIFPLDISIYYNYKHNSNATVYFQVVLILEVEARTMKSHTPVDSRKMETMDLAGMIRRNRCVPYHNQCQ